MLLRRSIMATAVVVGALSTVGIVGAAPLASASSVALKSSDVPAGYKLASELLTNAGMVSYSGIPKAQLDQHGRVTGLVNNFTSGSYGIVSFVSQYRSSTGATWEYGKSARSDLQHGKQVTASKVGDRSLGFTQTGKTSKGVTIVLYGIDFQKGDYDMTAVVWGPPGKASVSGAAHYAQVMVGRAH